MLHILFAFTWLFSTINAQSSCPRIRKEWNTATEAERNLYINGLLQLSSEGKLRKFTEQHGETDAANQAHGTSAFLPWHRAYLFELETQIRNLGGEYSCFGLLYWNWGKDVDDFGNNYDQYSILNSGLGGRGNPSNNYCVTDGPFAVGEYEPFYCPYSWMSLRRMSPNRVRQCCLRRVGYDNGVYTGLYSSTSNEDAVTASEVYGIDDDAMDVGIKDELESRPHGYAHCTIGRCGVSGGHLGNGAYSPDDPVFYLLHGYVDYLWALWQDYNNYELTDKGDITTNIYDGGLSNSDIDARLDFGILKAEFWSEIPESITIRDVHDISEMGYKYEYGSFIDKVDFPKNNLNENWFFEDVSSRRRRRRLAEETTYSPPLYSQAFDEIAYDQLIKKYGGREKVNSNKQIRRKLVKTLAKMSCEYRNTDGTECERPAVFDDCSDMERGPNIYNKKQDINVTLDELIEKVSDYPCMVQTRQLMYPFLAQLGGLWRLCRGDFDRFCDKEFVRKPRKRGNQCEARGYIKNKRKRENGNAPPAVGYPIATDNDNVPPPAVGYVDSDNNNAQYAGLESSPLMEIKRDWMSILMIAVINGIMVVVMVAIFMFCVRKGDGQYQGVKKCDEY